MAPSELAPIAHRGLLLRPAPLLRHQPRGRHEEREGLTFFSWGLPGPGFNKVVALGPAPPLDRIVELAGAFFGEAASFGVLVEADAGHPVEGELLARGWPVVEDEPALVLPSLPLPPPVPPELEVRRVRDAASRRDFLHAAAAGFGAATAEGMPALTEEEMDGFGPSVESACDPDVAVLVGYVAGAPVACAIGYRVEDVACITGVATVPEQRRRGYAKALTWAALAAAKEMGCKCAALNALGASVPLYQGMGFVHVGNHRTYAAPPAT